MKTAIKKRFFAGAIAAVIMVGSIPLVSYSAQAQAYPEGFVYANGAKFVCDGSPYYYGGTNCYYLTYKSESEVQNVFNDASDMGLKVIRVWGNLDVGRKTDKVNQNGAPIFEGNNDGDGEKDGIYFQYWDDAAGRPIVNEGADGLRKLDYVIKQAEDHDMKLIITFTNYWEAFGGMGQYVKWLQMSNGQNVSNGTVDETACCSFYTDETIKGWYKDYIKTLLNHTNYYTGEKLKDSEAIFSWELSNEPRCKIDEFCRDNTLYNWAKEMSEYVKSIDPYHMVSVGDEGFYNFGYQEANSQGLPSAAYSGSYGVDFEKLMTLDTIDFGTPHMYVDQWGFDLNEDDLEWIKRHGETTASLSKPIIFEEFGLTDKTKRDNSYKKWLDIVTGDYYEGVEYQGFNYWMIASYLDDGTLYQDYDGYTVYGPEGAITESSRKLMIDAAKKMNDKGIVNFPDHSSYTYDRSADGDIVVNVTMKDGAISGLEFNGKELSMDDCLINGSVITIKSSFLKQQELAKYSAKILTTSGNAPKFTVNVIDSNLPKPTIAPTNVSVDINPKVCSDVRIKMDKKTSEFRGLLVNGIRLSEGADYSVADDDIVTINASFLITLPKGANTVTFDFYEGEDSELTVNVSDTTGLDELDTFDGYNSAKDIWKKYSLNTGGNAVDLDLVERNGGKALAFTYNVGSPNGYCGINHPIAARDMSGFDGIEFIIEGDGSGNSFSLQLRDANNNYFEKGITLDFTGSKTIRISFAEFAVPDWADPAVIDTSKINQFSFYGGSGGNSDTGTVYIDNVIGYKESSIKTDDPYISSKSGSFDGISPASVRVDLVLNGQSVAFVENGGTVLKGGVDYSANGSQVMINESYLKTLEEGEYELVFRFTGGTCDSFVLTVKNVPTTPVHKHSYTSNIIETAACGKNGIITYTCTCGESYTEVIPALEHKWQLINTVAATETEKGYSEYKCSVCGETKKDNFTDPVGHKHNYTILSSINADCTNDGSVTYACSCGEKYTDIIPALGHTESGWIVDKSATDTTDGVKHIECTKCGEVIKSETIPATGSADKDESKIELWSGNIFSGSWDQPITLTAVKNGGDFNGSVIAKNGYLLVEFDGEDNACEIILQSWSGASSWARVSASETGIVNGHKFARFDYNDLTAAFGSEDFADKLDKLHIATAQESMTVYNVSYVTDAKDENDKEDKDEGNNGEEKPSGDSYVSAFQGIASCGAWGQAVSIVTAKNGGSFNSSSITENSYFYIEYSGDEGEMELILQSWSGAANWARVSAHETGFANGHYYSKFTYYDCVSAFGTPDFSKLDNIHAGAMNGNITVYSICVCHPA